MAEKPLRRSARIANQMQNVDSNVKADSGFLKKRSKVKSSENKENEPLPGKTSTELPLPAFKSLSLANGTTEPQLTTPVKKFQAKEGIISGVSLVFFGLGG